MAETPLTTRCSRSASRSAPRRVRVKTMHCLGSVAFQKQHQQVKLLVGRDRDVVLLDRVDRDLVLREVDLDRLVHVTMGQLPDVGIDRGRQQQRLAWGGQLAKDPLDVRPKSNVKHTIRLVEDHVNDVAQIERTALDVVEHAAGRADDKVDSPRECADLFVNRLAAEHAANRDVGPHRQRLKLGDNLLRELARRRQDDRLRDHGRELRASRSTEFQRLPSSLCPFWPGR